MLAVDPGRSNIGLAALSQKGNSFSAVAETRNKEIAKLMEKRRQCRRASRNGERKARQRLAKKYGTAIRAGMRMRKLPQYAADKFITCKVIRNTEARFCNRRRPEGWLTPTVGHLARTHTGLVQKIQKYLPVTDVAIEVNRFAFLSMEDPSVSGVDFQNGPLKGFDDLHAAVRDLQAGKCLMCKKTSPSTTISYPVPEMVPTLSETLQGYATAAMSGYIRMPASRRNWRKRNRGWTRSTAR